MTEPVPATPKRAERPLSPHLFAQGKLHYRPQISWVMSILHRMTGIGLTLLLLVLVGGLTSLASGEAAYQNFLHFMQQPLMLVVLFGLTFAFFYHLCAGIRHLLWDAGYFLSNEGVNSTGKVAIGVSVLTTLGLWVKLIAYGGYCPWMM